MKEDNNEDEPTGERRAKGHVHPLLVNAISATFIGAILFAGSQMFALSNIDWNAISVTTAVSLILNVSGTLLFIAGVTASLIIVALLTKVHSG